MPDKSDWFYPVILSGMLLFLPSDEDYKTSLFLEDFAKVLLIYGVSKLNIKFEQVKSECERHIGDMRRLFEKSHLPFYTKGWCVKMN